MSVEDAPRDERWKSYGDVRIDRENDRREKAHRTLVTATIDQMYAHLAANNYAKASKLIYGKLVPLLDLDIDALRDYDAELSDRERWNWYGIEQMASAGPHVVANPFSPSSREIIDGAATSVELIASEQNIIDANLRRTSDVLGYELQLGQLMQAWDDPRPEEIHLVDPKSHPPASLIQGLPGFGKSTFATTEAEDRHAMRNSKVVDFNDMDQLENGLYDVPCQDGGLLDIREGYDLPTTWADAGIDQPKLEILHPLVSGVEDKEFPYNTDAEGLDVRFYTIPASSLNRKALNAVIGHSTEVQGQFLSRAYQYVEQNVEDWTLRDLADALDQTEADERVKRNVRNTLETLQNTGFIRDEKCPYTLDWGEIFRDTDTITAFTCSKMGDENDKKLMVMAYLMNALYRERMSRTDLPRCTAVFREYHKVAPTSQAAEEDELERDLQKHTSAEAQHLGAMHRKVDLELLCDTQEFSGQIKKRVRKHFERVISFRSQYESIETAFSELVGSGYESHIRKVARYFDTGECCAVGKTGSTRPFEMTIKAAPPISHVYDERVEEDGWHCRVNYLPNRTWRTPASLGISSELPDRLAFDGDGGASEVTRDTSALRFAKRFLKQEEGSKVAKQEVYGAYCEFCAEHDVEPLAKNTAPRDGFGQVVELRNTKMPETGEPAYNDLVLTY